MTIDTSREAVERLRRQLASKPYATRFDLTRKTVEALLTERDWAVQTCEAGAQQVDAALAEIARLSTPPDDAEVAALVAEVRKLAWSGRDDTADALTRLSHALAAETAKREAMEAALTEHNDLLRSSFQIAKREGVNGEIATTNWDAFYNLIAVILKRHHDLTNTARENLAKHGSKT